MIQSVGVTNLLAVKSTVKRNKLARSCKIVQESCMQDLLGTCTRYVPFLARFLHNLAPILAKNCANLQVLNYSCSISCKILHHFLQDNNVQDCARIVQEKGHIACTCQASLPCKILAQSCMILQVRFCWEDRQGAFNVCINS